jgi:subtilisin family serine protease
VRADRGVAIAFVVLAVVCGLLWALEASAVAHAPLRAAWSSHEVGASAGISASVVYTLRFPLVARAYEARLDPNDPSYLAGQQWGLAQVGAPQAWSMSTGHAATVAVIDTGIDLTHPDLVGSLWVNVGEVAGNGLDDDNNGCVDDVHGCDFADGDGSPADGHGHGTHVAGIIGAETDNGIGVAGMGWGVSVMPVRVLDDEGSGGVWSVSEGILYAANNGARVINLSLGGYSGAPSLQSAISYAQSKGALVIAAAGNDNLSMPFYPAVYDGVVGVAATDGADQKAGFSNYGSYVDIAAPGVDIYSTWLQPAAYREMSGTSMAAPMVSGLAALVWTRFPSATASQVAAAMQKSAEDLGSVGWDAYFGWGRIQAADALRSAPLAAAGSPSGREPAAAAPAAALYRSGEVIVSFCGVLSAQQVAGLQVLEAGS